MKNKEIEEWKVANNYPIFQVWRQIRPLKPGEPMNSGVRETVGTFRSRQDAQQYANELNRRGQANGK